MQTSLLLLVLCFAHPACAQTPATCAATTTAGMQACAEQRYTQATAHLDTVYKRLLQQCSPAGKRSLVAAQQAWLRFRDADVAFVTAQHGGGTMAAILRSSTLASVTEARATELSQQLE